MDFLALARPIVTRYGMSDQFDMVVLETVSNQYLGSDTSPICVSDTASAVDAEVIRTVGEAHQKALSILRENQGKLHQLACFLLERETITGEEFMALFKE